MSLHVIQIRLTLTVDAVELAATPLTDDQSFEQGDDTQFAVLVTAASGRQAVGKVWLRLMQSFVADAVCSPHPDPSGAYLMRIHIDRTAVDFPGINDVRAKETTVQLLRDVVLQTLARGGSQDGTDRGSAR